MHTITLYVLTGFIGWTLFLLILMEAIRTSFLFNRTLAPNEFKPDNSNLPPFMQRLARAHANCIESFPFIGGLLIVALVLDRTGVTDMLAPWLLGARLFQSTIQVISNNVIAANLRFFAFVVQVAICVYWLGALLIG